jgi:hypothetical protein
VRGPSSPALVVVREVRAEIPGARPESHNHADAGVETLVLSRAKAKKKKPDSKTCESWKQKKGGEKGEKECNDPKPGRKKPRKSVRSVAGS